MSADELSKGDGTHASPSHDAIQRDDITGVGGDAEATLKRKAESSPVAGSEDSIQKRQKKETSEAESSRMSRDTESAVAEERRNSKTQSSKGNSPDEPRRLPAQAPPERRKNFAQEEKKRGQRLFGGLLSTLSRSGPNSQQQKNFERRQQERANNQRIEDERRRAERLAKLKHSREVQQITFDEQVMRTRHATMLSQAKSLRTSSKPEIYYRPWEPTAAQERLILKQVKDAEDAIADDIEQFKIQKAKRLADLGVALPAPRDEPMLEPPTDKLVGEPAVENSNATDAGKSTEHAVDKAQHDDKGVVVETEEDTVIY